jgi:hypothetical protein
MRELAFNTLSSKAWTDYQRDNWEDVPMILFFSDSRLYRTRRYQPAEYDARLGILSDGHAITAYYLRAQAQFMLTACSGASPTLGGLRKLLKAVSDWAKRHRDSFNLEWDKWIDMVRLTGYNQPNPEGKAFQEAAEWMSPESVGDEPMTHSVDSSPDEFYSRFEGEAETLFTDYVSDPRLTFEQFVSSRSKWLKTGAVDVQSRVQIADPSMGTYAGPSNKAAFAYLNRDDQLAYLGDTSVQHNYIFDKIELARTRQVSKADSPLYAKQAYVDEFLAPHSGHLANTRNSPVFSTSPVQWLSERIKMVSQIGSSVFAPIDQKRFEKQTNHSMLSKLIDVLRRRFVPGHRIHTVLEQIRYSITRGWLHVAGRTVPVTSGLGSGWKWTAFFNTLINAAELKMAVTYVGDHLGRAACRLRHWHALGDDTQAAFSNYTAPLAVSMFYGHANIEINTKVGWLDHDYDEFLRHLACVRFGRKCVTGYPIRAMYSILYRNPLSSNPRSLRQEVEQTVSNWVKLFLRLGYTDYHHMYTDLHFIFERYGLEFNPHVLHTPRVLGGFGLAPICAPAEYIGVFDKPVSDRRKILSHLPGLEDEGYQMQSQFQLATLSAKESLVLSVVDPIAGARWNAEYGIRTARPLRTNFAGVEKQLVQNIKDLMRGRINELPKPEAAIPPCRWVGSPFFPDLFTQLYNSGRVLELFEVEEHKLQFQELLKHFEPTASMREAVFNMLTSGEERIGTMHPLIDPTFTSYVRDILFSRYATSLGEHKIGVALLRQAIFDIQIALPAICERTLEECALYIGG